MLKTIRVRNLATIEDVEVEFHSGFNVLTGETGAGKSILVDALGLVAGGRADLSLVRTGETRAVVEAVFEPEDAPALRASLEARGLEADEAGLVIRREVAAEGAGRVFVNGSPSTVGTLKEILDDVVEIHGQHEHHGLLSTERHLDLLDTYGDCAEARERVGEAHARVEGARGRLAALRETERERDRRAESLRATLAEIDAVSPEEGEGERLDAESRLLRNAGRVASDLDDAISRLYEGEPSAAALAAAARRRVEALAELDPSLEDLARRVEGARLEIEDAGATLREYREKIRFEPGRLEAVESRRAALERLRLRFGRDEGEILAARAEAAAELAATLRIEDEIEAAGADLDAAISRYVEAASALTKARRAAAKRLAPAVEAQLRDLALPGARLSITFSPSRGAEEVRGVPLHPRGAERAELLLAANPGEAPRPLAKVASGGELSRTMLALHVVLGGAGRGRTLVFDEVDAGVGGAVASAIGGRLASLAVPHQVLCATHLPQVAAHGTRHYHVAKRVVSGRARTEVVPLSGPERVEELARMLAGKEPTPASRRNAEALLAEAAPAPARRRA